MIGSGEERHEQRKNIQTVFPGESFKIKKDEVRVIPFTLPVNLGNKASIDLFGGKLEISASSSTPQNLEIVATVDLDGVAIDLTAGKAVSFTG